MYISALDDRRCSKYESRPEVCRKYGTNSPPWTPFFFSSDIKGLGPVDPSQIEVIHATPNPGAQGFRMGALETHRKELENLNRRKLEKINELNTLEKIRGQRHGIREQA